MEGPETGVDRGYPDSMIVGKNVSGSRMKECLRDGRTGYSLVGRSCGVMTGMLLSR